MDESVAYVADSGGADVYTLAGGETAPIVIVTRAATRFVIFNRPSARNALTRAMRRAFAAVLAEADADVRVRAVIVTGAGGVFCAGVDIKESRAAPAPMVRPHPGEALRGMSKSVIAAVDGACITGGLEIALNCSFILASARATFADSHAKVGFFPAWGLTAMLPRAIGMRRARQMMLTAAPIDAERAYAWGLVNEVVAPPALLPRALELADGMSGVDADLVRREIELMARCDGVTFDDAITAEAEAAALWRETKS